MSAFLNTLNAVEIEANAALKAIPMLREAHATLEGDEFLQAVLTISKEAGLQLQ